nr:uncharacterized protein LOC113700836 [Coffea arabica]
MGFCPRWIQWIMECVTSVTYSVNINGEKTSFVRATRGLRQGDPLFPYLFLICAEGFSSLIKQANVQGKLTGMKIPQRAPSLSHLFFAADSLMFCKTSGEEAVQLRRILDVDKRAFGQLINAEKSSLFFSKNVKDRQREGVMKELQGMQQVLQSKYLGLPLVIGRSKRQVFGFIRQKTITRLKGWKEKLLGQTGKEVLLKFVIMALPTYVMSCYLLPKALCKEICSEMAKFWWGQKRNGHKIHWLSWGKITEVKAEGRLGFRELHEFNLALLAKQLWRILTRPNLLMSKIMKARYFKGTSIWKSKSSGVNSSGWKSLLNAKELLEKGIKKRVGDGKSINIWEDRWLSESDDGRVKTRKVEDIKVQREGLETYKNKFWHWWEEQKDAANKENGRERIVLTINLLWQIWKSRNERQFNDKGRDPWLTANKAVMEWREYQDAQEAEMEIGGYSKSKEEVWKGWKRPKEDWVKINFDAALHQKSNKAGWGMVARKWQGMVARKWQGMVLGA